MRPVIAAGVAVLLLGGLFAWHYATHEKEEVEVYVGYRGEARYNRFLAADHLLNALGIEAVSRESFLPTRWLPPPSDTILMRASAGVATGEEFDALTSWVTASGGHLVLLPPREPSPAVDDLLAYFGLAFAALDDGQLDSGGDQGESSDAGEATAAARGDDSGEPYDYELDLSHAGHRITERRADAGTLLVDDHGNIAVRVAEGNGYVTVIAGANFFTNEFIADADHARLLLDVVAGYVDPGKVWLIFDASFPSLPALIWQVAPYLVISLAALFLFWLWATMPRFGPKIRPEPESRRSIREHVSAAGNFAWRNDATEDLASSVVAAMIHAAERHHPGIGRQPVEKQARSLARLTGLDAELIFNAMISAGEKRPREFTENVALLQTIRKAL